MKKLMILLFVLWGFFSTASAFTSTLRSASWGYQPVYEARIESPTYQFRSTSACASTITNSKYAPDVAYTPGSTKKPRKWGQGTDPDEEEVGELAPVGEPYILLLLAFLWIAYKKKRATAK